MGEQLTIERIKDWLVDTVSLMVENRDKVSVNHKIDDMGVLFTLKVGDGDVGRVIGKQGAHAKALRELLRMLGANAQARISLQMDVPDRPARTDYPRRDKDYV